MKLAFNHFELDLAKAELKLDGATVGIGPRVFSLLCLIIENNDRLVLEG
jgi:DNA-binding winged helix-turn-helix (wHTH) protein